jgi:putative salt-induced outer membrane protein YdiY
MLETSPAIRIYRLNKSLVANWNNARKSSIAAERTKRKEKKGNVKRYKFADVDDKVMATNWYGWYCI